MYDDRQVLQRIERLEELRRHLGGALDELFLLEDVARRDRGGRGHRAAGVGVAVEQLDAGLRRRVHQHVVHLVVRSEEHTSELQSLMRISYAVFCLKKTTQHNNTTELPLK